MVITYPTVVDEFTTLALVAGGKSIARFGDGEFKQATGCDGGRQKKNQHCALELRMILVDPHPDCLVGIPTMHDGPKLENWLRHHDRILAKLSTKVTYYSSLITRPDSAPWIFTREYCEQFEIGV